jgi:hypothetical protein
MACALALAAHLGAVHAADPASLPVVKPAVRCAALADVDLQPIGGPGSSVTTVTTTTSGGVAVCSVEGTLAPEIRFQVLLPSEQWTQRYLQVGCGGLCGRITLTSGASDGCPVLNAGGFVMAATDMGHAGGLADDGRWGLDARKRTDFAHRAQHLTALAAKALIQAYYGQAPRYAYFNGCSDGGREALMEAMRHPGDFDGVIAGAPALLFQVQNTLYHAWQASSNTDADGKVILLASRLPLLHKAVLAACDGLDGAEDGLIAQPANCHFDVVSITCAAGRADTSACLTPAEAAVVRKFYEGPRDPSSGAYLTAGQPLPGSELEWAGVYVADRADGGLMSTQAALPVIRHLAFDPPRPEATLASFPFTEATLRALQSRHGLWDATQADLSAFARSGGKLILWHGLADPHISPVNTVALHQAMTHQMGGAAVQAFERLYLLPGVSHCGNGQGPSQLDLLTPMMAWVEQGQAPDAVMTRSASGPSHFGAPAFGALTASREGPQAGPPPGMRPPPQSNLPAMSRPVYPYPAVARYTGHGDVHDAENWGRGGPASVVTVRDWPGSGLFGVYPFNPD